MAANAFSQTDEQTDQVPLETAADESEQITAEQATAEPITPEQITTTSPPRNGTHSEERSTNDAAEIAETDDQLGLLRGLILDGYDAHVASLQAEVASAQQEMTDVLGRLDNLDERMDDEEALLNTISPVIADSIRSSIRDSRPEMIEAISPIMADTIRTSIRDSKDEMIDVLYPIMGQLVQRSVREAMKDLVRRIDNQIQSRFSFRGFARQMQARATGVSPAELALRESLPFEATDLFLIHRHSGLLLLYVSDSVVAVNPAWASEESSEALHEERLVDLNGDHADHADHEGIDEHYDSDLISGMLTAIQDFVQDAFGREIDEHLDQVAYGGKQILIETAQNAYMAVVVEGTEPYNFRATMRDCLQEIEHEFSTVLPEYDGNAAPFESKKERLQSLLHPSNESPDEIVADEITSHESNTPTDANLHGRSTESNEQDKQNSTSLHPLSILILINLTIIVLWWLLQ